MNAEKLRRLQAQVRIGGKGTPRRKKKVMHQSAATDDKKLQSSLKKLSVSTIPGIEEVNIIKDDLTVIHFNNPKAQASLSANTFAVTGHGESKKIVEMLPEILPQLGQETVMQLRMFANTMSHGAANKSAVASNIVNGENGRKTATVLHGGDDDDDDEVPLLVNDFEQVAKLEEAAKAVKTMKVVTFQADSAPDSQPLNVASSQLDKLDNLDKRIEDVKNEVPMAAASTLTKVAPTTPNKIHNTKIQKTAHDSVKDERKGNKKSNNKQQQQDQINVHDVAAKNKTETITKVVVVEDKKAKQMKNEKSMGQQQDVKISAAPLIVSDNAKNNKKEKQDKQKMEMSAKDENKMKEDAKASGKSATQHKDDNERKMKGKKDKENLESSKSSQDAKAKEKQEKLKDVSNESSKSVRKDKKPMIEEHKTMKKNDMELIKEKDANKEQENESKSVEVNKKIELQKEGENKEKPKAENKHLVTAEKSKSQTGKIEKEVSLKKVDKPVSTDKMEADITIEASQVKSINEPPKTESKNIQDDHKELKEISSGINESNLLLDASSKSNSELSPIPAKSKQNELEVKIISAEKTANGSQKEKVKPKNDVATKKGTNKEGAPGNTKEKAKDLKLDINKSKQADVAANKGPQSKSAPILEVQRSPKLQTTKKEPTSAKNLEKLNTTSKGVKQIKEVAPQVISSVTATDNSVNLTSSEGTIVDKTQNNVGAEAKPKAPPTPTNETMLTFQAVPEDIVKKESYNAPSISTRNTPNVTSKSNTNAKSKTTGRQQQDANVGAEKSPSKQHPNKSTVPPKSNAGAVEKALAKSEKQAVPLKAATDIIPKPLQQSKNESMDTLNLDPTSPSVDVTNANKGLESTSLTSKPAQTQEVPKEAQQSTIANTNIIVSEVKLPQSIISAAEQTQQVMSTKTNIEQEPQKVTEQEMQKSVSTSKPISNVVSKSLQQSSMKTNEKSKSTKQHQAKLVNISADKVQDTDGKEKPNSPSKSLDVQLSETNTQEGISASLSDNISPISISMPLVEQQLPIALGTQDKLEEKNKQVTVSTVSIVSVKTEPTGSPIALGGTIPTFLQEAKCETEKNPKTQLQESSATQTTDKQESSKQIQPLPQPQSNIMKCTNDPPMPVGDIKVPLQSAISETVASKPLGAPPSVMDNSQIIKDIISKQIVTKSQTDNQCLPIAEVNIQPPVQNLSLPSQVTSPLKETSSEVSKQDVQQNPHEKLNMPIISAPLNVSPPGNNTQNTQQVTLPNIIDAAAIKQLPKQSNNETKEVVMTLDQNVQISCGQPKSVQIDGQAKLSKDLISSEIQATSNQNTPKVELNVQASKQILDQQKHQQQQQQKQKQQQKQQSQQSPPKQQQQQQQSPSKQQQQQTPPQLQQQSPPSPQQQLQQQQQHITQIIATDNIPTPSASVSTGVVATETKQMSESSSK